MLAEIFMLRLEVMARTSRNPSPGARLSSCPSPCQRHLRRRRPIQVFARPEPPSGSKSSDHTIKCACADRTLAPSDRKLRRRFAASS